MLKQYVFIPKNLRMSLGKACSQACHASYFALELQRKDERSYRRDLLDTWKENGMCVVILEVKDVTALFGIEKYCTTWGIIHYLYVDEGLTEVDGMTPTCLATGIIEEAQQETIFNQFKVYTTRRRKGGKNV